MAQTGNSEQEAEILQVIVHAGPLAGKAFLLTGDQMTFGRDADNDIVLDDDQVSRHHARLYRDGNRVILEDLGSTNGTLVNKHRISGPHVLQPADIITMGSSVFGVRGFSAPSTVGVTAVSPTPPTYTAPPAMSGQPRARRQARPADRPAPKSNGSTLMIVSIVVVGVLVLAAALVTAYFLTNTFGGTSAQIPTAVITAPQNGSQVAVGEPVAVQVTASDPSGVRRMELWVSGVKTAEAVSPAAAGQPVLTAVFEWVPPAPGSYTLELRAYNRQDQMNVPAIITVQAVGQAVESTPTPTLTPAPPTPTVPTTPLLTTKTDLNVRIGPGLNYDVIGLLPVGASTDILGRSEDGEWWQIRFTPAADGLGWVSAKPEFSTAINTDGLPVVPAPATPTPFPTATPTPTETPTETPTPPPTATLTPTPSPTPTSPAETVVIEFSVSPDRIEGGECVEIGWNVSGVKAVYFGDEGVVGQDSRTDCPKETTTYRLRVILKDDSEQVEERTVTVLNPISSTGKLSIDPNQTVDFDRGQSPGDDFILKIDGSVRQFAVLSGVQLAPMRVVGSLKELALSECAAATFGVYTFIDGSDSPPDPNNALVMGRSACYRTNEGRLGKLRFSDVSNGKLTVEWLTWK